MPAAELGAAAPEWIADDRALVVDVENALARELGLTPGAVLLDFPAKTQMLGFDIAVLRRSGSVERISPEGWAGAINLPALADQLYASARWLRVFAAAPLSVPRNALLDLVAQSPAMLRRKLAASEALLG
jgi:hypothetical protein